MDEINEISVVETQQKEQNSMVNLTDMDLIIKQGEMAEKAIKALNKVMAASIRITTEEDWVLISGKPYLQESGTSKIGALFGLSQEVKSVDAVKDSEGYTTFTARVRVWNNQRSVEAEGSRSSKEDFFSKGKSIDEIELGDVRRGAITNALNIAIKRMIPGTRGITVDTLSNAGLNLNKIKGFNFKTKTVQQATTTNEESLHCEKCGKKVNDTVANYSKKKFGKIYCMDCQKDVNKSENATDIIEDPFI